MLIRHVRLFLKHKCYKFYSSKSAEKIIKYTDTINLPKTKFPLRLSLTERNIVEKHIVENQFGSLYNYQQQHKLEPEFVLHDGPPYANGDLHMGHAVNKILKDVTLKQNIINNKSVHYKPGWDCHGLPIELKVIKGDTKASPFEIRQKSRKFALDAIKKQKSEFISWGILGDWRNPKNTYETFNMEFIENQLKTFLTFYKRKLVFRDMKPVFWSPSSRTALAEAELEYDPNFESPSIILRLKMNKLPYNLNTSLFKNVFALIWTTTPWTLPANQAICFNPILNYSIFCIENEKENLYLIATNLIDSFKMMTNLNVEIKGQLTGESLSSCTYYHPIDNLVELPFLPGKHVNDSKGTGLVHTAPAHGHDDFLIGLQNNIKFKNFIDDCGKYTEGAPNFLLGKYVLNEGDKLVISYLHQNILYNSKIVHSYPIDWRTKKPVIIKASNQWFMNTESLKKKAVEEIEKVKFYPKSTAEQNKQMLIAQVLKRPYWCISRQRVWGVPIPVFYNKTSTEVILNEKIIKNICDNIKRDGNIDFWWTKNTNEILREETIDDLNLDVNELEKSNDIFDIWFDSGLTWLTALDDNKIADMYLEGYDQFSGWFQSSLLTSVASRECAPYKSIFVHGFTVDKQGQKMSKSLGNIISPRSIVSKYGADTLRWWVASHGTQHSSITVDEKLIKSCAESVAKIRSMLKYMNGVLGDREVKPNQLKTLDELCYLDKFILNELYKFGVEVQNCYNSYEYNKVIAMLQYFTTNHLSGFYMHLIKDRLYCGTEAESNVIKSVLMQCYEILCKTLWPIIPFTVEESWSYYDKTSFYEQNIKIKTEWQNDKIENLNNSITEIKSNIYKYIKNVNTWTLECEINCNLKNITLLKELHPILNQPVSNSELTEILQLSNITLNLKEGDNFEFNLKPINSTLCPRCRRFALEDKNLCDRCALLLS